MSKRPRDSQQTKIWRAIRGVNLGDEANSTFGDLKEFSQYLARVLDYEVVKRNYPKLKQPVNVHPGSRVDSLHYRPGWVPPMAHVGRERRTRFNALLIGAYHILQETHGSSVAWHGREWAMILLDLVHWALGQEVAKVLQDAYVKEKVRYRPKRQVSDATRARLKKAGFPNAVIRALREHAE